MAQFTPDTLTDALARVGIQTQASVAMRVLTLCQNPDAQISDYCEVVEKDWSLSGRIFRLANSAFFAQRHPVTKLHRALVLLGLNRVRAITLGFHLCRSATPESTELTRRVWGESIYRACLASTIATRLSSGVSAEAFVIGLMLDVGVPLLDRIAPEVYPGVLASAKGPGSLPAAELEALGVTHTDVAGCLAERWRLPALLAQPIVRHHERPKGHAKPGDELGLLHRIASYVGAIALEPQGALPKAERPLAGVAAEFFAFPGDAVSGCVRAATEEYRAASCVFEELAAPIADLERVEDLVHAQLVGAMDDQMAHSIYTETSASGERFQIDGHVVEIEPAASGEVRAFIVDERGDRLIACSLRPGRETPRTLKRHLGLDESPDEDFDELMVFLGSLAA